MDTDITAEDTPDSTKPRHKHQVPDGSEVPAQAHKMNTHKNEVVFDLSSYFILKSRLYPFVSRRASSNLSYTRTKLVVTANEALCGRFGC